MSSPRYHGDWASEDERVGVYGALMARDVWSELSLEKDRVYATLPWKLDIDMDRNSGQPELYLYATQSRDLFVESYAQVITESYMEGDATDVFITEKTCRSVANLQPFLVFGHTGTLRRLRKHGFEATTFFDGSYDEVPDLGHRLTSSISVSVICKPRRSATSTSVTTPISTSFASIASVYSRCRRSLLRVSRRGCEGNSGFANCCVVPTTACRFQAVERCVIGEVESNTCGRRKLAETRPRRD